MIQEPGFRKDLITPSPVGSTGPQPGTQGWCWEGPASAENKTLQIGYEERMADWQLTTGTQGQPPSVLQKNTSTTVRKGPGTSVLPDPGRLPSRTDGASPGKTLWSSPELPGLCGQGPAGRSLRAPLLWQHQRSMRTICDLRQI